MNQRKLFLDIAVGAILPVLVLKYGTKPLGELPAYLISALIPVLYVAIELAITRKLNVITTFMGLTAVVNGLLAFWFVGGWRYALKDSAAMGAMFLLLAGSAIVGRPLVVAMLAQAFSSARPVLNAPLRAVLRSAEVYPKVLIATWGMALMNLGLGVVNFALNYHYVFAAFPSEEFNTQKANVDAMTRIGFPIVSLGITIAVFWAIITALLKVLPGDEKLHLEDRIDLLSPPASPAPAATPI
jgi:hypothetical protein